VLQCTLTSRSSDSSWVSISSWVIDPRSTIAISSPPLLQRPVRDVPDRIGCVLPEALQDLPGELANLCISGGVPPLVENVPPRPDIAGDDHLDFGCVRQHRTSRLKRLLAPVSATDQLLDQRGVRIHCV